MSLYFVCQTILLVLFFKTKIFCVPFCFFKQSHITKHTSVTSPRKTLITTTLSTKCLSYCNISKPSHMCTPMWRPVCSFVVSISIFVVIIISVLRIKKTKKSAHWFSLKLAYQSPDLGCYGEAEILRFLFFTLLKFAIFFVW